MAKFTVTAPDGKTSVVVEAENAQDAYRKATGKEPPPTSSQPSTSPADGPWTKYQNGPRTKYQQQPTTPAWQSAPVVGDALPPGFTIQPPARSDAGNTSTGTDIAKGIGSGLVTGATGVLGMPQDFINWADKKAGRFGDWIGDRVFGPLTPEQQARLDAARNSQLTLLPTSEQLNRVVESVVPGATTYEPQTTAGRYAQAGASLVPGAMAFGGGGALKSAVSAGARYGVLPGLAGEAAVQATNSRGKSAEGPIRTVATLATLPFGGIGRGATAGIPSAERLKEIGGKGMDATRAMGVIYDPSAVQARLGATISQMKQDGILASAVPRAMGSVKMLATNQAIPISDLMAARSALQKTAIATKVSNPTEGEAVGRLIDAIDGIISDPSVAIAGPAVQASRIHKDARGNYAAAKRSEQLFGIDNPYGAPTRGLAGKAQLRANATASGMNMDNLIRQKVATLLSDPKQVSGFTKTEIGLLETVANGTAPRDAIRWVGNYLGGGGGLGATASSVAGAVGTGIATGDPLLATLAFAAPPTLGAGAKALANKLTMAALRRADEAVRMRSPYFSSAVAAGRAVRPPASPVNPLLMSYVGTRQRPGYQVVPSASGLLPAFSAAPLPPTLQSALAQRP
jgi:hypothetical protein